MREIIETILKKYNGLYFIGKEYEFAYYILSKHHVFNSDLILEIEKKFPGKWFISDTWTTINKQKTKIVSITIRKYPIMGL